MNYLSFINYLCLNLLCMYTVSGRAWIIVMLKNIYVKAMCKFLKKTAVEKRSQTHDLKSLVFLTSQNTC